MKLQGDGSVSVSQTGGAFLLSRTPREVSVQSVTTFRDPYLGLGFYSYRAGSSVVISEGHLRVTLPAGEGGTFGDLDSGIAQVTLSNFPPGQTGFVVFKYARGMRVDGFDTTASDQDVNFGDPSGNYFVSETVGFDTNSAESNTVETWDGEMARYGYVWMLDPPLPSPDFFQSIICRVLVSTSGVPAVFPVHFGDLLVPLAYTGKVRTLFTGHND